MSESDMPSVQGGGLRSLASGDPETMCRAELCKGDRLTGPLSRGAAEYPPE